MTGLRSICICFVILISYGTSIAFALVSDSDSDSRSSVVVTRFLADNGVLTDSDQQELLDQHNTQRSVTALGNTGDQPAATNMVQLQWDEYLAKESKIWADTCQWAHDPDKGKYQGQPVGENLYTAYNSNDVVDNIAKLVSGVDSWYDEHKHYIYDNYPDDCQSKKQCGHYTANIWATTTKVGCAYATCGQDSEWFQVYMVCRYSPAGNIGVYDWGTDTYKMTPYQEASDASLVASDCPSGYSGNAESGLCVPESTEEPPPLFCGCDAAPGTNQPDCRSLFNTKKKCQKQINNKNQCAWTEESNDDCTPPPEGCYSNDHKHCVPQGYQDAVAAAASKSSSCQEQVWLAGGSRAEDTCAALWSACTVQSDCCGYNGSTTTSVVCFEGDGDGDAVCVPEVREPEEPQECSKCKDKPKKKGQDCASITVKTLGKKCQNDKKWRKKKSCQLSCYNSGAGYEGDVCCN